MKTKNSKKYTDNELYLLIQQKDKRGFDQLYNQYSCMLYGLALQSVRSREYAEEITTLTFENAWKSIQSYNHEKVKLQMWMVCLLIRSTKDYLSKKSLSYTFNTDNFPNFSFDIIQEKAC
jgi:DNA-directed RNA polymerase specialized sigma24 family protein